jgi:tRNA nucleotidyltransferase/poly(A) polymerase
MVSFKDYVSLKEAKDWKADVLTTTLPKGFVPPLSLRPIIKAFLSSGNIILQKDTSGKHISMPKKSLYLVGGSVRDFISGKTPKDLDLATNATPEQIALILSAAGFKRAEDRSGKDGQQMHLPSQVETEDGAAKIEDMKPGDKRFWFIKGRDSSPEKKAFVISAVVDGEEYEIATFRKDAKVTDGAAEVDFTDNPKEDADRRDLTYNSLYIDLTKPDGENKILHDPTRQGLSDLEQKRTRTVGKAEERFEEDPLRVMRAIRFHCRFSGGGELDPDIKNTIPKFRNLHERVAIERIRDEFLKGLLHPEIDPSCYLKIYHNTGMMDTVFPGVDVDLTVPDQFKNKKDKVLSLAWLLRRNPRQKVGEVLSPYRNVHGQEKPTGWQVEERKSVLFLLHLTDFDPSNIVGHTRQRLGTGLSDDQIRDWVAATGHGKPVWAKMVTAFSGYRPNVKWEDAQKAGLDICPVCAHDPFSAECHACKGSRKLPPEHRGHVISGLETERFKKHLSSSS